MDRIFTDYRFEEPLRGLLHEFKYREGLYLSSFLASLIAHSVSKEALNTQCLIPIPLHTKRLQQRGFNQAALLTKHLSNTFGIPYQLSLCKKIQHTPPQAGLTAEHRRLNLKKAFHVPPMPYQHITLVDDLLTTGSTAHALASLLKQQGVIRVDVWCCAKA